MIQLFATSLFLLTARGAPTMRRAEGEGRAEPACDDWKWPTECNAAPGCVFSLLTQECEYMATVACDEIKFPSSCNAKAGCGFSKVTDSCTDKAAMSCEDMHHTTCKETSECYLYKKTKDCVQIPLTAASDVPERMTFGDSSPDSCPAGFQPVTTAHDCFGAALSMGKGWLKSISSNTWDAPGVCTIIVDSPTNAESNDKLYFGEVGSTAENTQDHHKLVCVAEERRRIWTIKYCPWVVDGKACSEAENLRWCKKRDTRYQCAWREKTRWLPARYAWKTFSWGGPDVGFWGRRMEPVAAIAERLHNLQQVDNLQ